MKSRSRCCCLGAPSRFAPYYKPLNAYLTMCNCSKVTMQIYVGYRRQKNLFITGADLIN